MRQLFYYKMQQLFKNATFITNCDSACSYNPKYSQISHHLREMDKALDVLTWRYDNIILMSDFNAEPADTAVSDFC